MPISNEEKWKDYQDKNTDGYGAAIIAVARRVMTILDEEPGEIKAMDLIRRVNKERDAGGLSGFQAGAVAGTVYQCHSRGDEFGSAWDKENDIVEITEQPTEGSK